MIDSISGSPPPGGQGAGLSPVVVLRAVVPTLRELASEKGSKEQTHRQRSELSSDSDSYTEESKTGGRTWGWLLRSDSSGGCLHGGAM